MNPLGKFLADSILEQEQTKTVALYGGGFKPPHKGHFEVVEQALKSYPQIDEFIVYVGSGVRDGIEQAESLLVWDIYRKYLPLKVKIEPVNSPITAIYDYIKNHPDEQVIWVIGAREGKDDDFVDMASRTKGLGKYENVELAPIVTKLDTSGTDARKSLSKGQEAFNAFIPDKVKEKTEVYNILSNKLTENFFEENIQYWINEDIKEYSNIPEYKIDLNNIYSYKQQDNLWKFYDDINNINIIVKLKQLPNNVNELKFYAIKDDKILGFGKLKHYNSKVMNTVFKIFKDEILPNNTKILIQPFDNIRYRLFRAMINNNLSKEQYNINVKDNIETPIIYIEKKVINESLITNDLNKHILELTKYMVEQGMNIKPLPKVKFVHNDEENANNILGKTAYYNPSDKSITLFTLNRHPKDVLRSFAHEMIHHEQNLDNRLNNISTTNTNEDGDLPEIEKEAYQKGNMMLRNWEDKIKNV